MRAHFNNPDPNNPDPAARAQAARDMAAYLAEIDQTPERHGAGGNIALPILGRFAWGGNFPHYPPDDSPRELG